MTSLAAIAALAVAVWPEHFGARFTISLVGLLAILALGIASKRAAAGDRVRHETERIENTLGHATSQDLIRELIDRSDRDYEEFARERSLPLRVTATGISVRMFMTERWLAAAPALLDPTDKPAVDLHGRNTLTMFRIAFEPRIKELIDEVITSQSGNAVAMTQARYIESMLDNLDQDKVKVLGGALSTLGANIR